VVAYPNCVIGLSAIPYLLWSQFVFGSYGTITALSLYWSLRIVFIFMRFSFQCYVKYPSNWYPVLILKCVRRIFLSRFFNKAPM